MDVRLYIANLSPETSNHDLLTMFSKAGSVALAEVVIDPKTGRSRGFGFVSMPNQEDAEKAVRMFNETNLHGRMIRVNITLPRKDQPASSTGEVSK